MDPTRKSNLSQDDYNEVALSETELWRACSDFIKSADVKVYDYLVEKKINGTKLVTFVARFRVDESD